VNVNTGGSRPHGPASSAKIFDHLLEGHFLEISEFTCIKKDTIANAAFLKDNVRLPRIVSWAQRTCPQMTQINADSIHYFNTNVLWRNTLKWAHVTSVGVS
jgi:hypothetical protein